MAVAGGRVRERFPGDHQPFFLSPRGSGRTIDENKPKRLSAMSPIEVRSCVSGAQVKGQNSMNIDDETTMSINTIPGEKVRFSYPKNGLPVERVEASKLLTVGAVYTVASMHVDNWYTDVELKEVPGVRFNSVFFKNVGDRLN